MNHDPLRFCALAFADRFPRAGIKNFDALHALVFDATLLARAGFDFFTPQSSPRSLTRGVAMTPPSHFQVLQNASLLGAALATHAALMGQPVARHAIMTGSASCSTLKAQGKIIAISPMESAAGQSRRWLDAAQVLLHASHPLVIDLGPWRSTFDAQGHADEALEDFLMRAWAVGARARSLACELDDHTPAAPPRETPRL